MQPYAQKYSLTISKPDKYRTGETSTLAIIQNAFLVDGSGNLDLDKFIQTLKNLEQTIDKYCTDKENKAGNK